MKLLMENWREYLKEEDKKIMVKLFTDRNYLGAEVDDDAGKGKSVIYLNIKDLVGLEPDKKMKDPKSAEKVEDIANLVKKGKRKKIDPILVRKYKEEPPATYQILDGHHRFHGFKKAGEEKIQAKIIPDNEIEEFAKPSESVDEIRNPFRKQDIGPPKEKRNKKEAQISGEDFKDAEEIFKGAHRYICILSLHGEAGQVGRQSGFPDRDCRESGWWQDDGTFYRRGSHIYSDHLDQTLSDILEEVIEFYEERLEPLLAKLIIARGQIENYGKRFPKELRRAGKAHDRLSKSIEALENHRNALLGLYKRLHGVAGLSKYKPEPGIYDLQKLRQHAEFPDLEKPMRTGWTPGSRKTTNLFSGSPDED